MKKSKVLSILFLTFLIIFSSSLINVSNTKAATTIGDTSVGVDMGDIITWIVTEVNETNAEFEVGDLIQYQINDISENLVPGALAMNISRRKFDDYDIFWFGEWTEISNGSVDWYYNATNPNINGFNSSNLFIVPIPLDIFQLSYIIGLTGDTGNVIGTNGLNCTGVGVSTEGYESIYYEFNAEGIATSIMYINGSDVMHALTLVPDDFANDIYGVEVGDILTYTYTEVSDSIPDYFAVVGDKLECTIVSISNLFKGYPCAHAIINMTGRFYNSTEKIWYNSFGGVADVFAYNPIINTVGVRMEHIIIPVPIDMPLMCELHNSTDYGTTAWAIGTNGLSIIQGTYVTFMSYNSKGIATSIILMNDNEVMTIRTLEISGDSEPNNASIPLGSSFLIFGILAIVSLVVIFNKQNKHSRK